jgi:hypothetical protein
LNKSTGDLRKATFELGGFSGEVLLTTTVEVSDDNCHHKSSITVSKISSDLLSLNIESECEHIKKAAASLGQNLNRSAVTGTFDHNIVYEKVSETMPGCVVCAVPCAIVKASWAELGMNLRKGAHIQFI